MKVKKEVHAELLRFVSLDDYLKLLRLATLIEKIKKK